MPYPTGDGGYSRRIINYAACPPEGPAQSHRMILHRLQLIKRSLFLVGELLDLGIDMLARRIEPLLGGAFRR